MRRTPKRKALYLHFNYDSPNDTPYYKRRRTFISPGPERSPSPVGYQPLPPSPLHHSTSMGQYIVDTRGAYRAPTSNREWEPTEWTEQADWYQDGSGLGAAIESMTIDEK